jgi:tetratricopeptide (TPR) repeat protein
MPNPAIKSKIIPSALSILLIISAVILYNLPTFRAARIYGTLERGGGPALAGAIVVTNPFSGCIFPPEIVAPTFRWTDSSSCDQWLVSIKLGGGRRVNEFVRQRQWRPGRSLWESIKARSTEAPARVEIIGLKGGKIGSAAGPLEFTTSKDPVGNPIFYREVTLPFADAVKDPSRIRWRFGSIDREQQPPVVLEHLPVCGNCHTFSADGSVLGMDVDYANDKGAYALTGTAKHMNLAVSDIISWSDYKREDKVPTFGLLSQVSPDGRYVVSTVKDLSIFVPRPDLAFSQLFFPIKGILLIYSRQNKTFLPLPGADDSEYVQSNATWTPDGNYLLFARSKVYHLKMAHDFTKLLLSPDECSEFLSHEKEFKFDIYRIPFNGGKGGKAEPLPGASGNGSSNFFARVSPDGKWVVFCKASSFMLLQPDSKLWIMPAQGGQPRLMQCNTPLLNSWHCWSSNSRWIVFSSKVNTPYTQLFLTHVDGAGNDAPPVLLEQFTQPDRAANIPEFMNGAPDAIQKINEQFVDDVSLWRAGRAFEDAGDFVHAGEKYRASLSLNPKNVKALLSLGKIFENNGLLDSAFAEYSAALGVDSSTLARINLGNALLAMQKFDGAIDQYRCALGQAPNDPYALYNIALANYRKGEYREALRWFTEGERTVAGDAGFCSGAGNSCRKLGDLKGAIAHYTRALAIEPNDPDNHFFLGSTLAEAGKSGAAVLQMREALKIKPDFEEAKDSLERLEKL